MAETDLTKMTSAELVEALIKDNSLAEEFDHLNLWEAFNSDDWCELLTAQPQFAEKAKEYSHGWVGLLSIKPELANECECWEKFYSWHWCDLLSAQPQFADKCTKYKGWEKFGSANWSDLLSAQPQFADKCTKCKGWEKFYSWNWSDLLKAQPQFADKCTKYNGWEEINSSNWYKLLSTQPQFADKCTKYNGWKKIYPLDRLKLIESQPQLWIYYPEKSIKKIKEDPTKAKECKCWERFHSRDCSELLSIHPQFADKCNWTEMRANNYDEYDEDEYKDFEYWKAECGEDYSENWKNLLLQHPQLAEYFTDALWDEFSQEQWTKLLKSQPQFTEKAKEYSGGWVVILQSNPELAEQCDKWDEFASYNWRDLLTAQPQFADKCYKWETFDYYDWSPLLSSQPQFADKCPDKIYDQFSEENWRVLEAKHPGVFEDKHMLSTLRKLAK